jgi:hypothetical protein
VSDRDELAKAVLAGMTNPFVTPGELSDALWAEGWRKKPSREDMARAIGADFGFRWNQIPPLTSESYLRIADAILALMDGGSDDR